MVAPTGSPSTVRFTTYAGSYSSARFIPMCPTSIGPSARAAKMASRSPRQKTLTSPFVYFRGFRRTSARSSLRSVTALLSWS